MTVKRVLPIVVGLVVYVALTALLGMYGWTAIHSGWSQRQVDAFRWSFYVLPPLAGIIAAFVMYRSRKRGSSV